jgi:hypothetical protein
MDAFAKFTIFEGDYTSFKQIKFLMKTIIFANSCKLLQTLANSCKLLHL